MITWSPLDSDWSQSKGRLSRLDSDLSASLFFSFILWLMREIGAIGAIGGPSAALRPLRATTVR